MTEKLDINKLSFEALKVLWRLPAWERQEFKYHKLRGLYRDKRICKLRAKGLSVDVLSELLRCHPSTVYRARAHLMPYAESISVLQEIKQDFNRLINNCSNKMGNEFRQPNMEEFLSPPIRPHRGRHVSVFNG